MTKDNLKDFGICMMFLLIGVCIGLSVQKMRIKEIIRYGLPPGVDIKILCRNAFPCNTKCGKPVEIFKYIN